MAVLQNRRVSRVKSDTGVLAAEDGVTLLAGVVLIYLAGGVSGRRCWVSVSSVAHRTLLFMPVVSRACCSLFTSYQISHATGGAGVFSNDVWWVFICLFLTVASWLWVPSMQVVQVQRGPTIQLNIRIDSQPQTMNSLKLSQAQILTTVTTSKYPIHH